MNNKFNLIFIYFLIYNFKFNEKNSHTQKLFIK